MKATLLILAAAALLLPLAIADTPAAAACCDELAVPGTLAGDRFAFGLFRVLAAEGRGNVTFSPASLEASLRLLAQGAAGTTRGLLGTLPLGRRQVDSAMQVHSANALFAEEGLPLKATPAPVQRVPFSTRPQEAAAAINAWCSRETQGLVPRIVDGADISPDTRLTIVNALYLKEKWLKPFDADATDEQGSFTRADGTTLRLPLMHRVADFFYAEGEDWQAVALFYRPGTGYRKGKEEPGCFIAILPKGDARAFAKGLTPERYDAIRRALVTGGMQEVSVMLPRMDIDSGACSLRAPLAAMGLGSLFTPESDFSGFADERLYLSDVLQRCRVLVEEEGTEAAAVTAMPSVVLSLDVEKPEPKSIHFTRPFIWAIGDLTTAAPPYFLGLCEEPAQK